MKYLIALGFVLSFSSFALAEGSTCGGKICYTTKENVFTKDGYELVGLRRFGIYVSDGINSSKGTLFRYVDKKDYGSEEEAERAAISFAEQLETIGHCRFLRGWLLQ